MKRFILALALAVSLTAIAAPSASAAFGLKDLGITFTTQDGSPAFLAGSHPFALITTLDVNAKVEGGVEIPEDAVKDLNIAMPAGLVGNPQATPRCSGADFANINENFPACSNSSAVGIATLKVGYEAPQSYTSPVYNLVPPPGAVESLGFIAIGGVPVTVEIGINRQPPYNPVVTAINIPQPIRFYGSEITVWGNPASPVHDSERGRCIEAGPGTCSVAIPEKPFLTLPRSCTGPLKYTVEADSWQNPGSWLDYPIEGPSEMSGCSSLNFSPHITAQPTTRSAESASGLEFEVDVEDENLASPSESAQAQSDIKKAVVTMPKGMTLNPSAASGLATCSEADFGRESVGSAPGEGCPQASKVGEVEVETPLLEGTLLHGSIFVAAQDENPFHSLVALYMVIKDPELGILVKLPGKVDLDESSGQLVTTFGEAPYEIPQFPFSHFRFHFREGPRSPLVTPPTCGEYPVEAELTPWSGGPVLFTTTSFSIDHGVQSGSCPPAGISPFAPGFEAGSVNNVAGAYSPFYMRLVRKDGEQDMTRFSSVLPPGVTGKLAGVAKCSEAQIALAESKSGRAELADPSCPAASRIGHSLAGAGVGSVLTYVPGSLYLAGPFAGDPLSIVAVTPAVAGPFDAGTVVVREALTLNPATAEVQVDGAASDPIPHILKGIPLKLRDLRIYVDRENFTLNPTSCDPESVRATLFGSGSDVFNPVDDVPVSLSQRYQAASCASLGFKPKLSLKLKGGTKRGQFPSLRAEVTYPPGSGYSNIGSATVTLPHSAFLEQGHIGTICTRVQFAANACPAKSVYGHARAFTPLLDEPLEGPVYLRSNGGERDLPDLVADLHGIVNIELVGYVDSVNARLRSRFLHVPDAPISKFVLEMQGGKKGLIVNSADLCAYKHHAQAILGAQNGTRLTLNPVVQASGCKKGK